MSKTVEVFLEMKQNVEEEMEKAKKGLSSFGDYIKKNEATLSSFGKKISVAGGAITALAGFAVKSGAEFESLRSSFDRLSSQANLSGDELLKKLREVSEGTITQKDLVISANKAMSYGVSSSINEMAGLLELARLKANDLGMETTQAYDMIIDAVGKGQPKLLASLGIMIDSEAVQSKYAESLGKTSKDLTLAEQKQAILNETLKIGQKSLEEAGGVSLDLGEKIGSLSVSLENMKTIIGMRLLPVVTPLIEKLAIILNNVVAWIDKNPELSGTIATIILIIGGLMLVLGPLLIILPGLVTAFGLVSAAIPLLVTAFGVVSTVIGALLSPIALVIAAIIGLVALIIIKKDEIVEAWSLIWTAVKDKTVEIMESMKEIVKGAINWVIDKLNTFVSKANGIISRMNSLPGINIPTIPNIPRLAKGGVVYGPTQALIGEREPEIVMPLSKMKGQGSVVVNINNPTVSDQVGLENLKREIIDAITRQQELGRLGVF